MEAILSSRSQGASAALIALATAILMLGPIAQIAPANADPGNGQSERAAGSSETTTTEDDDGDGVDNCPDDYPNDSQHPSGKDRYCESGNSGNQGNAQHDPDDDGRGPDRSNGGVDQPGGSGGDDIHDQDGNNGCGNDQDFEDDNEGWCGGNPNRGGPEAAAEEDAAADAGEDDRGLAEETEGDRDDVARDDEDVEADQAVEADEGVEADQDVEVRGVVETRDSDASPDGAADEDSEVLGVTVDRNPGAPDVADAEAEEAPDAAAARLPRTGSAAGALLALGVLAAALGGVAVAVGRRRRAVT